MNATRALRAPPGQPDPDRGRLAVSVNAVFNPAAAQLDGDDRAARPRRGPDRALAPLRRTLGQRHRRLDDRPGAAARARRTGSRASSGASRTHASSSSPELDRWVITCTAYGPAGPAVFLATTEDFSSVERHGIVRQPEDKNAALLPHRIDGKWILFHRPMTEFGAARRTARSCSRAPPTSSSWSAPEQVLQPARGRLVGLAPDRHRAAAAPNRARLAADLPRRQGDRRRRRLPGRPRPARPRRADPRAAPAPELDLRPAAPYEREGDVPNVVFPVRARPRRRPATRSGSTTAPPTRRSASPRHGSATCSKPCSARPVESSL